MTTTATMRADAGNRGAVRVEDVYDTDVDDLWEACTTPERLSRWVAQVSGDLREGGMIHAVFTSAWTGPARIDICQAPRHLLLTMQPGTDEETQVEAWLTPAGSRARLVVEERGLSPRSLPFYGAGWQVHLEDLRRALAGDGPVHPDGWSEQVAASGWQRRWEELTPLYRDAPA